MKASGPFLQPHVALTVTTLCDDADSYLAHPQCARDRDCLGLEEDRFTWRCPDCVENALEPDNSKEAVKRRRLSASEPIVDQLPASPGSTEPKSHPASQLTSNIQSTENLILTNLLSAIERGNVHEVRELLEQGRYINAILFRNNSPLCLAILGGHMDIIDVLLIYQGPLDDNTDGPLDLAVQNGSEGIVRILLSHGIVPSSGHALRRAVEHDAVDIVEQLLNHGLSDNGVPLYYAMQPTLLSAAVTNGSLRMVDLLIRRGFSPKQCPDALLIAATLGFAQLTTLLLANGTVITYRDHMSYTALSHAALNGQNDVIRLLLSRIPSQYFAIEALIAAASTGKEDAFDILWQHCKSWDIMSVGSGTVVAAATVGHVGIMRTLLSQRSLFDLWSSETEPVATARTLEYQALDFHPPEFNGVVAGKWYDIIDASVAACLHGQIEIVKLLTEDMNKRPSEQQVGAAIRGRHFELIRYLFSIDAEMSPGIFQLAAEEGDAKMCRLLLDKITVGNKHKIHLGTCLAAASKKGKTALVDQFLSKGRDLGIPGQLNVPLAVSVAVENGRKSTAMYLIDTQQSFTLENTWIRHSLTVAVSKGFADVVHKLLHQGVDIDFGRRFCYDLLHTAYKAWHLDIVESLLQSGAGPQTTGLDTALGMASSNEHDELHRFLLARKEKDLSTRQVSRQNPYGWFELVFPDLDSTPTPYTHNEVEFSNLLDDPKIIPRIQELNQTRHALLWSALITVPQSVVLKLISLGADVNIEGQHGKRPLHTAASMGYDSVVKALLEEGADPNFEDDAVNTPLDAAIASKSMSVVHCLIDFGAIVDLRTMALTVNRYEVSVIPLSVLAFGWESNPLIVDIRQRLQERPEVKVELLRCIIQMHLADWINAHHRNGTSMLDDPNKSQSIDEGIRQDIEMRIYENWLSTEDESGDNPFRKTLNRICGVAQSIDEKLVAGVSTEQSTRSGIERGVSQPRGRLHRDHDQTEEQNQDSFIDSDSLEPGSEDLGKHDDHGKDRFIEKRQTEDDEPEQQNAENTSRTRSQLAGLTTELQTSETDQQANAVDIRERHTNSTTPITSTFADKPRPSFIVEPVALEAAFQKESNPTTATKKALALQMNLPLDKINVSTLKLVLYLLYIVATNRPRRIGFKIGERVKSKLQESALLISIPLKPL